MLIELLTDTARDTLTVLPFLFLTYLLLEYMEWRASDKTTAMIARSKRFGPVVGSLLGLFPQCGFSAISSEFYTHRIITLGTLMAIYLSTSDEMLPILLAEQAPAVTILRILAAKIVIGMLIGFVIDLIFFKKAKKVAHKACGVCGESKSPSTSFSMKELLMDALKRSLEVFLFLFIATFLLDLLIEIIGENSIAGFFTNKPIIGELLAGLFGLIPNCAGSVIVTQLYLKGTIQSGAAMAGLLSAAGVGPLMLLRTNKDKRENTLIIALLYGISVLIGILFSALQIAL